MANSIKESGEGSALQVTRAARSAGLVEEDHDGNVERRANVRVHSFDGLLVVVDLNQVTDEHEAELVAAAARDTGTAYQSMEADVQRAGNGYQVQLPPASDADLEVGDRAPVQSSPGVLFVHQSAEDGAQLARDLVSIRESQLTE